jgi:hypothetical protein
MNYLVETNEKETIMKTEEYNYTMSKIKPLEDWIAEINEMEEAEKEKERDSIEQAVFNTWLSKQENIKLTFQRELKEWKDSIKSDHFLGYD